MKKFILACSSLLLLSACSVQSETWVSPSRVEIHDEQFTDSFDTAQIHDGVVHAIADYYHRFGNGPLNMIVSYDPLSRVNTEKLAQRELARLEKALSREGVKDIKAMVNPMRGSGDISTTLVSFSALAAHAPSDCGMMPGYSNAAEDIPNDTSIEPPYRYGCTVETLLARQVARPSDLMGKPGFGTKSDGRRAERVLSTRGYYGKDSFPDLSGEKASE
jgi:type IV pilus biogenesis protein CpaD/CtpE